MAKKHKSVRAAQEAGSLYFYDKNGTKKLAVTAEQLNAWKKKNKGKYKGSALTAWANNKGKDVGAPKKKEPLKKKDAISDEQRSRQTSTPPRLASDVAIGKVRRELAQAQKDKAAKRAAIQKGKDEADKILADTGTGAGSGPSTRPNNRPKGPKAEVERRTQNKNKSPDELNTQSFDSVKRTDRKGVSLTREELKAMNEAYPRNKMNKGGMTKKSGYMGGGMTKKKVMTYNLGGMVKSQTNNLKKGRS